jgi:hypothetical protein
MRGHHVEHVALRRRPRVVFALSVHVALEVVQCPPERRDFFAQPDRFGIAARCRRCCCLAQACGGAFGREAGLQQCRCRGTVGATSRGGGTTVLLPNALIRRDHPMLLAHLLTQRGHLALRRLQVGRGDLSDRAVHLRGLLRGGNGGFEGALRVDEVLDAYLREADQLRRVLWQEPCGLFAA